MVKAEFTPTQQRFLDLLSDGMRHRTIEFRDLLHDTDGERAELDNAVRTHMCHIKDKIRPKGKDIICEYFQRKFYYRLVILVRRSVE